MAKKETEGQSPVVRSLLSIDHCRVDERADGSVTVKCGGKGYAPKVVTMYPVQWSNLLSRSADIAEAIAAAAG